MAASKSGNTRQLSNPSAACHPHAICKIRSARSDQTLLPGCSSPLMRLSEHRRCFKPGEQKAWSGEAPTAPPLRALSRSEVHGLYDYDMHDYLPRSSAPIPAPISPGISNWLRMCSLLSTCPPPSPGVYHPLHPPPHALSHSLA